jgi:hypothetical protein
MSSWKRARAVTAADLELYEAVAATALEAIERIRVGELEHRLIEQFQERLLRVDQRAPVAALASRYRPTSRFSSAATGMTC